MSDKKNFQSQIVKRRHSKHFAFRCLLDFRNLADFKDSEIPIIDWGALSLTNIFLTCIPVYILYINICLYLIYNPRSDLTTITWQGLAQLLRRWLRHWEFGKRYWYDIQYSDWRIQNGHHLWNSRKEYLWKRLWKLEVRRQFTNYLLDVITSLVARSRREGAWRLSSCQLRRRGRGLWTLWGEWRGLRGPSASTESFPSRQIREEQIVLWYCTVLYCAVSCVQFD